MSVRFALFAFLSLAHLALVVCGAAHWQPLGEQSPPGQAVAIYGALSGADNSYGFFAPGVAAQLRATFTLSDDDGHTWTDVPERAATHEANLRLQSTINMIMFDELRDGVVASWAADMLARHPSATSVEVRIESLDLPTMEGYREGIMPEWNEVQSDTFTRAAGDPSEDEPSDEEESPSPTDLEQETV